MPTPQIDPLSLIVRPDEALKITRRPDGDLAFVTRLGIPITHIHAGETPETIRRGRDISFTLEDRAALVDHAAAGLDPGIRHYFSVTLIDGTSIMAAERVLPLVGGFNARDLGGYPAAQGRTVRWGRLFRSGHLHNLTPDDQAYLERMGLRLICDLRLADEAARQPDQPIRGARTFARPLLTEGSKIKQLITLILYRNRLDKLLLRGYIGNMIDQNAAVFGALYRQLATGDDFPALVHCTAGKDRAGMAIALLLRLLGVSEEVIAAEYSLSNAAYAHFKEAAGAQADKLRKFGVKVDDLHPMLLADPTTMKAALAYVREQYGGVEAYLTTRAGLRANEIDQLRDLLLT